MTRDPRSFNEPGRKTLEHSDVEGLGAAILVLTREVWVLTDRLAVMEAVLANRGIDISNDIEAFEPDEEMQAELNERGKRLTAGVINAIAGIRDDESDS